MAAKKGEKSGPPAKRSGSVQRTADSNQEYMDQLHQRIVDAHQQAMLAEVKFWHALSEAHQAKLANARKHPDTVEYLVTEFKYDRRSAQYQVRTVETWHKMNLSLDLIPELGPTVCREIATYLHRAGATPKVAKSIIEMVKTKEMTARQMQDWAHHQLEDQSTGNDGRGQPRDQEPRKTWTLSATDSDKRAIMDLLPELEQLTGTKDPVKNMKLAVVELANSRSENPEDALEYAGRQSLGIQRGLDQVVNSIYGLQETGRAKDAKMADKLMSGVTLAVLRAMAAVSAYVDADVPIDPKKIFRALTNNKPSLEAEQQSNLANTCLLLARLCGADEKVIEALDASIRPPDVIDA